MPKVCAVCRQESSHVKLILGNDIHAHLEESLLGVQSDLELNSESVICRTCENCVTAMWTAKKKFISQLSTPIPVIPTPVIPTPIIPTPIIPTPTESRGTYLLYPETPADFVKVSSFSKSK